MSLTEQGLKNRELNEDDFPAIQEMGLWLSLDQFPRYIIESFVRVTDKH